MKWVAYGLRKRAPLRARVIRRRAWVFVALLSIGIAATPQPAASQTQVNQIFQPQGPGPRIGPSTVSPVRNPNFRIWLGDT